VLSARELLDRRLEVAQEGRRVRPVLAMELHQLLKDVVPLLEGRKRGQRERAEKGTA